MDIQLSNKEIIYLYGNLKKQLKELETIKPKSIAKEDIQLHKSIIESIETAMPQLKTLPLQLFMPCSCKAFFHPANKFCRWLMYTNTNQISFPSKKNYVTKSIFLTPKQQSD